MSPNRVARTLYRQLLSWCREYQNVPFDGVPPLTLTPPQVNSRSLKRLHRMRTFLDSNHIKNSIGHDAKWRHPAHFALYNTGVSVKDHMIVFPTVYNANELRDLIRSVFWLNNINTTSAIDDATNGTDHQIGSSPEEEKEQISIAFDAMKSCNELSAKELNSRRHRRQTNIKIRQQINDNSIDGPNVKYHVGQVVAQNKKGFRGVIVGWAVEDDKSMKQSLLHRRTSLTTKQYSLPEKFSDTPSFASSKGEGPKIKYTILVDVNDAALLEGSKIVSLESQEDLTLVEPYLQRIHNKLIRQYFIKFESDHFVPNNILNYVYPMDEFSTDSQLDGNNKIMDDTMKHSFVAIVRGIEKISKQLKDSFERSMKGCRTKSNFLENLMTDLPVDALRYDAQVTSQAYLLTSALYNFHVKINSLLWSRKKHLEHKQKIKYNLGDIVRHKNYDYKGVVVAWDHKPSVDVRGWDGVQHIDNPQNQPFYHVVPDTNDCIRTFGAPRSFRYVCQENLEQVGISDELEVDDLNLQEWKWDNKRGVYDPTVEMRFLYGEQLDSEEHHIEQCLQNIRDTLSDYLLLVRNGSNACFTLDDLFCILQSADTLEHATHVQDLIKEMWKLHPNTELRDMLDNGIAYLVEGNSEEALSIFRKITKTDSSYQEAWNKAATALYMMGCMEESLCAAQKALEIEPRNFQALAGIGLVEMESNSLKNAIAAFENCISLNPWSIVSARLAICRRKFDTRKE